LATKSGYLFSFCLLLVSLILLTSVSFPSLGSTNAESLESWTATSPYPGNASGLQCVTSDPYLYCINGSSVYYTQFSPSGEVGTWTKATSYPNNTTSDSCVSYGDYIYCVSGCCLYGPRPTADDFYGSLSSSGIAKWVKTTPYPNPVLGLSCAASDGYIYCVGGYETVGTLESNQVYYAPISSRGIGTWNETTNYPVTIGAESCSIFNSYIYCVGGDTSKGPMPVNSAYYAPVSSSGVGNWTNGTDFPASELINPQSCVPSDGYLYCITDNDYYSQLGPNVGAWIQTTSYPDSRGPAACVAYAQYLYCAGGSSNSVYYSAISSPGNTTTTTRGTFSIPASTITLNSTSSSTSVSFPTTTNTTTTSYSNSSSVVVIGTSNSTVTTGATSSLSSNSTSSTKSAAAAQVGLLIGFDTTLEIAAVIIAVIGTTLAIMRRRNTRY
jgi:hypothetical protein